MGDLRQEWIALSAAWIREAREGRNPTREGLLDPPILAACGDVAGKRCLDCGCGEGRFVRKLAEAGADYALGIDLCEPLITAANELKGDGQEYRVGDVQDLGDLPDGSFDLGVSYVNHCDLPDFAANTREVFRVLRRDGRFVVANLHPMRSAHGSWHRSEDGTKLHVPVDNYFDEGERHWQMMGCDFTNFHRSLETYINTFLECGFALTRLIEPTLRQEQTAAWPELVDEIRAPNFIIFVLDK